MPEESRNPTAIWVNRPPPRTLCRPSGWFITSRSEDIQLMDSSREAQSGFAWLAKRGAMPDVAPGGDGDDPTVVLSVDAVPEFGNSPLPTVRDVSGKSGFRELSRRARLPKKIVSRRTTRTRVVRTLYMRGEGFSFVQIRSSSSCLGSLPAGIGLD